MERQDHKPKNNSTSSFEGWQSRILHEGRTELIGTPREAVLLVRGLQALRGQLILNEASGTTSRNHLMSQGRAPTWASPETPLLEEVETLLQAIQEPNYVDDTLSV